MKYIGRLQNGVELALDAYNATGNDNYAIDPTFNVAIPSDATNITVTFTDDSSGTFLGASGWLMMQRGQPPSSNSDLSQDQVYWTSGGSNPLNNPPYGQQEHGAGVFELSIPTNGPIAGEWFVALDVTGITFMDMKLKITWDHTGPTQTDLGTVANGPNGAVVDGQDSFLNVPPSGGMSSPIGASWTIVVPAGNTITALLDDNANGDIAASIANNAGPVALAILFDNELAGLFPNDADRVSYHNAPYSVSYTNSGTTDVTVNVTVISFVTTAFNKLRLLVAVAPGVIHLSSSDGVGAVVVSNWINDSQVLSNIGLSADVASPGNLNLLTDFTTTGSTYPGQFLAAYPPYDPTAADGFTLFGRFTWALDGTETIEGIDTSSYLQGGASYIVGYTPQYMKVMDYGNNNYLSSPVSHTTFEQSMQPQFLYAYERVQANWTRPTNEDTPTWNNITLYRKFAVVVPQGNGEITYPAGAVLNLALLFLNGSDTLPGTTMATITGLPVEEIPFSDGTSAQVVYFGDSYTYTVGDNIVGSPNETILTALQNALNTLQAGTTTTGTTTVNVPSSWWTSTATLFRDPSLSNQGLIQDTMYHIAGTIATPV